ncbi:MAG: biotin-dependent carboxyltransferase family protein [Desulfobacteraceae bacterium]
MKAFKIVESGPFTTVQDRGRYGFQRFGVPPCGSLDSFAADMANLLVGNLENEALLEFTFSGGLLEVLCPADIALAGADMEAAINDRRVDNWCSFRVLPGDRIRLNRVTTGCRTYLAVTGGIDVPLVMGSRSCYTGAKFGGFKGRPLAAGDLLERGEKTLLDRPRALPGEYIPRYGSDIVLRAIPGPQEEFFDQGMETFFTSRFTVSDRANRMGYRLQGDPVRQKPGMPKSIISEPSLPGGVQIPEDGQPIILLSEQTVGGYSKIATVISADIPKIAQAKPGERIFFQRISLDRAHAAYAKRKEFLETLQTMDLEVKSPAAMGKTFFSSDLFKQLIQRYMLQV